MSTDSFEMRPRRPLNTPPTQQLEIKLPDVMQMQETGSMSALDISEKRKIYDFFSLSNGKRRTASREEQQTDQDEPMAKKDKMEKKILLSEHQWTKQAKISQFFPKLGAKATQQEAVSCAPDGLPTTPQKHKQIIDAAYAKARQSGFFSPAKTRFGAYTRFSLISDELLQKLPSSSTAKQMHDHAKEAASMPTPPTTQPKQSKHLQVFKFSFKVIEKTVSVQGAKYRTGNKLTAIKVMGPGTYPKIAEKFAKVPNHSKIAEAMMNIALDKNVQDDYKEVFGSHFNLISNSIYLLFGAEAFRESGSIIANLMFLELVKAGKYTLDQIATLPMSMSKAKGVARSVNTNISTKESRTIKRDPKISSKLTSEFFDRHQTLSSDWVELKTGKKLSEIPSLSALIHKSVQEWFSLSVRSTSDVAEELCTSIEPSDIIFDPSSKENHKCMVSSELPGDLEELGLDFL